jgi:hypothetical protein
MNSKPLAKIQLNPIKDDGAIDNKQQKSLGKLYILARTAALGAA